MPAASGAGRYGHARKDGSLDQAAWLEAELDAREAGLAAERAVLELFSAALPRFSARNWVSELRTAAGLSAAAIGVRGW